MKSVEPTVTLRVPAAAEYVDLVRLTLYGVASKIGFSYEDIEDMKVAVSEACNNAVLHAYEEAGFMEIRFTVREGALSISVKDEGRSFEPRVPSADAPALLGKSIDDLQAGGLGLFLMQALMDDVEVHGGDGGGTEVILTKRLARSEEMA
ncbi:anti-sigma B factor RsbW [Paenibacillus flagellatus]|uniref:Anti-sigma B factor RsbW n=1 Tax=Paenibacillus flagellatus TaxID=2211139 RepID=A0A2V5KA18_9BACL|nr:anti-sigma B factor RsbW [Paenibacillus flagellatus]PYI50670.1 anti-sigma B factor RsbW [Paenibacillus flagellatus]